MRKKIFVAAILSAFAASSAFALTINSAGTSLGGGTYKPSTGVTVVLFTNGTAGATDGTTYAAGSANRQGSKEYATNNTDPKIYYKASTATTSVTPSVSASTWAASSGWLDK